MNCFNPIYARYAVQVRLIGANCAGEKVKQTSRTREAKTKRQKKKEKRSGEAIVMRPAGFVMRRRATTMHPAGRVWYSEWVGLDNLRTCKSSEFEIIWKYMLPCDTACS